MIVNCPSCSARFRVPAEVVPAGGRNVRCSACGHVWHFAHPDDVFEADTPDFLRGSGDQSAADFAHVLQNEMESGVVKPPLPQPDEVKKPARKAFAPPSAVTKRPFWRLDADGRRGYAAAMLVFCLIVLGFAKVQQPLSHLVPAVKPLYVLFGAPRELPPVSTATPDITMGLVNAVQPDAAKLPNVIKIDGVLNNEGKVDRPVLPIRVRLLGAKPDQVVATWIFKPMIESLPAGESSPFEVTRAVDVLDQVHAVDLSFFVPPAK